MKILKTYIDLTQLYVEWEYKNIYPTYVLNFKELHVWSTGMLECYRAYVPIGYIHEDT